MALSDKELEQIYEYVQKTGKNEKEGLQAGPMGAVAPAAMRGSFEQQTPPLKQGEQIVAPQTGYGDFWKAGSDFLAALAKPAQQLNQTSMNQAIAEGAGAVGKAISSTKGQNPLMAAGEKAGASVGKQGMGEMASGGGLAKAGAEVAKQVIHPDTVVADSIMKGAGARLSDPATYEGMNPQQLAQAVHQAAGLKQQTEQNQTFQQAMGQAATSPMTLPTMDQEVASRIQDMSGVQTQYNEPVGQGGPGFADKMAYYLAGIESPRMKEANEFAGARGRGFGEMAPGLEKEFLRSQQPLGTFETAQLGLQERLGMAERGIQQQQKSKERADVARSVMFPGTQWIPFLQPQALKDYLGTGGPGTKQYAEATGGKQEKLSEKNLGRDITQRPNFNNKQIESYNKLRSRGLSQKEALSRVQGGR